MPITTVNPEQRIVSTTYNVDEWRLGIIEFVWPEGGEPSLKLQFSEKYQGEVVGYVNVTRSGAEALALIGPYMSSILDDAVSEAQADGTIPVGVSVSL
ncbi:MAG: hypothetical protein AAF485_02025 [Chloroflexota bacterium]